jgi:hypothetical protein
MLKSSTMRPGLLVSLKTSISGNINYNRRELEHETKKTGEEFARWETERTIADPQEHDKAVDARCAARSAITRICTNTAFGLLCPEDRADELEKAVQAARDIADTFNSEAKLSRLGVYVITGRIAQDDVEAVRAINSEVRDLLRDMSEGLKNLDVKAVRAAANKAKSIGAMLSPDAAARIQIAIDAARSSAKQMVKAGEQVSMEIDNVSIRKITEQRTAFLDIDESKQIAKPKSAARAVDLTQQVQPKSSKAKARAIELD